MSHSSSRRTLVHIVRFSWKILLILALIGVQGWQFSSVHTVQAAPEPAPLSTPGVIDPPEINLSGLGESSIGSQITFTVTFNNNDPENETGYGPFIEFELPAIGADGAGAATDDGLTFVSASYLGAPIAAGDIFVKTFDATGSTTHPLVRDTSGNYVTVSGTAGDQLVVIRLPFGSFTPAQPPATISITVQLSNLADLTTPLNVRVRGGYQFGSTALDDWCCDAVLPTLSGYKTGSVTPTVMTMTKTYTGPSNISAETATGESFTRTYTITADIATGQTVQNVTLIDTLPDNIQFVGVTGTSPAASCTTPSTSAPGGTLSCNFGTLTGVSGTDAQLTFSFYVPRLYDAPNPPDNDTTVDDPVIDPSTGDDQTACNNARSSGDWTPFDGRDSSQTVSIDPAGCEHTLTVRSIATQKGSSYSGTLEPGTTLVYTLDVQVSDYFAFDGLVLTDVISDGQHFDAGFIPEMSVDGNGFSMAAADITNFTAVSNKDLTDGPPNPPAENPATDGTTTLTFSISNEVIARAASLPSSTADEIAARNHALVGRLVGGCVPLGGSSAPECGSYDNGGTTVTIVFHTIVDESFTDDYPSGDWSVDQGDILENHEAVIGNVLDTSTFTAIGTEDDDALSVDTLDTGSLTKSIYAINGSTSFSTPVKIKPGDTVTYRLTYSMPTSDEENLELTDYLPLPIFDATEVSQFDTVGQNGEATVIPAAGHANFGPLDTFYTYSAIVPTLTTDSTNNSVDFFYGDFDDPADQATKVDLFFTVTVSDEPFADGLYLTNQAHAYEGSTNGGLVTADSIVQLILQEPVIIHSKGVVATNSTSSLVVFDPTTVGPVTFNNPGTSGARWTGTVDSDGLEDYPIDSNITGVDAGDLVTFAIVIENIGSSPKGAFDISILDTLPSMYQVPAGGLNLRIANGDNSTVFTYHQADGTTAAVDTDIFTTGIRIDDPDPDHGACQSTTVGAGKNIIIITYDLQVRDDVVPGTDVNTATLERYAGVDNGPNHVPATKPTDDASSEVVAEIAKTLIGTEINTTGNDSGHAVIGELVTYEIQVAFPEGKTPNATVTDTLDPGLAYVRCDSISASSGLRTNIDDSAGALFTTNFFPICNDSLGNPAISSSGHTITFNLGDINNTDRDSDKEILTIQYTAVVLNTSGNNAGTGLNNQAYLSWRNTQDADTGQLTVTDGDANPNLSLIKTTDTAAAVMQMPITYRYTLTNTGNAALTGPFMVTDDHIGTPLGTPFQCGTGSLAPGASLTCTASYIPTDTEIGTGYVQNNASATATGAASNAEIFRATNGASYSRLSLVMTTDTTGYTFTAAGDVITYRYTLTNTGNAALTGPFMVTDDHIGSPLGTPFQCGAGTLIPGHSLTCTAGYTVTAGDVTAGTVENKATAVASGSSISSSLATLDVTSGADSLQMSLVKTTDTPGFQFSNTVGGDTITYSYEIINTGNVTLDGAGGIGTRFSITDDVLGTFTCGTATSLAPGGRITCTKDYTPTSTDMTAGSVENTAHAVGNYSGSTVSSSNVAYSVTDGSPAAQLQVVKMTMPAGATFTAAGDQVSYDYEIINTGNVSLYGPFTVTDDKTTVTCPSGGLLAPGESLTCTSTYTVTAADVLAGYVTNSAAATSSLSGGSSVNVSALNVVVIEPNITTVKKANGLDSTKIDAGNIVTFDVTLTNDSGTDAYDITWADSVPVNMTYSPTTGELGVGSCATAITSVDDSAAPTLTASISHLAPGETCVLTFDAGVNYVVEPGNTITNTATTQWTSLNDTKDSLDVATQRSVYNPDSIERTGSGTPSYNDYTSNDTADVVVNDVTPNKYLVTTSEDSTSDTDVTIGEIVRYRLVVSVPEGTSTNFQVVDQLPAGMTFLNDSTAKAFFVYNGSGITSSAGIDTDCVFTTGDSADGTLPAIPVLCDALGNNNISSLPDSNADTYSSGFDVYFKFGTLNNNDDDPDSEYVVIEFNALVDNSSGGTSNDAGEILTNNFIVTINDAQNGTPSNDIDLNVLEPSLTISKAAAIDASRDAGDTVTYTLTVNAASDATSTTAFDLALTDVLDANLTPVSVVPTSTTQGATCSGGTVFSTSQSFSSQTMNASATCLDPGSQIVFTITATLKDTTAISTYILENDADLTYTSLPGTNGTTSNATGSQVTTGSGTSTGERNGNGTAPNDYTSTSPADLTLTRPSVVKVDPSPTSYTIGETVTYDIEVTLPEGVTQNLVVTDNIPSGTTGGNPNGLKYVSSTIDASSFSDPTEVNSPTVACAGSCATGDDVTFTFGDVTTDDDNVTTNNTFIIRVTLLVENVLGNQDGTSPYPTTLTNATTVTYTGGTTNDSAAAITVIEPRIATNKTANPTANVKAGDTVTYTVRFTNTGNSTAYDVTARDTLAQGMDAPALTGCVDQASATVSSTLTDNGATIDFDGNPAGSWDIAVGNWIECTYTTVAQPGFYLNGNHQNLIDADWTSLNGVNTNERNYNDGTTYNFDGSQDADTADVGSVGPTLTKSDGGFTAGTIGDVIHYTITVGGSDAIGTLRSLVITDTLPAGVIYDGNVVITGLSTSPAAVVSSPNDGSVAVTVTWNFGDVYKSAANATITFDTHLSDYSNTIVRRPLVKTNSVGGSYTNATGTNVNFTAATDAFTIIEPIITTAKDTVPVTVTGVKAGDTVTYRVRFTNTGDSNAYDVTAQDTLAAGMSFGALANTPTANLCAYYNGSATSTVAATTSVAGNVVTFDGDPAGSGGWDIPSTNPDSYIECIYTAIAQTSLYLDGTTATHQNSMDADWTSQNGATPTYPERNYNDSVARANVDGAQDTDTASFTTDAPTLAKSDGGFTTGTIGDSIHYTITVGGANAIGTIRSLVITDTLPAGVIYDGNVVITGLSTSPAAVVSNPNDGSAPVTVTWNFGNVYKSVASATITFDTHIADNSTTVQRTFGKTNSVGGSYTNAAGTNVNFPAATDAFVVIEPIILTDKTVLPTTSVQAGDTVTYTVLFTNTGNSTAYDVTALDTLAQGVVFGSLTGCVNQASAVVPTTVTDLGATLTFDGNPAGSWDIAPGNWIQCVYTAVAQNSLYMNGDHINTVDADWTSQNGATPTYPERTYNDVVNRTGVDEQPNGLDDDGASFLSDAPTFVKDDSGVTQVVIGDTITFHLTIGGEAGTYRSVVIADHLPVGLIYNNDAAVVLNGGSYAITPTVSATNNGTTVVDLTWNFGNIYKNSSDMVITYSARVANVVGNSLGDVLINNASLDHYKANGTAATQLTDTEQSTIAEPVITTTKSVSPLASVAAGDVVTYTVEFENTGSSTAYEVSALDTLAQGVTFTSLTSCLLDAPATDLTPATTVDTGTPGQVTFSGATWDIPATSTVTCIYTATAQTSLYMDGSHVNTIDADWTSQNGVQPNERNYDDSVSRLGVDETPGLDDDDATFTSDAPTFVKDDNGVTQVVIGDTITFHLTVGGEAGTYRSVVIADHLPAGLIYNNDAAVVLNGGSYAITPTVSATNDGTTVVDLTWNFGDIYKNSSNMVITYTAQVANVIGNQIDGTLLNNATLDHHQANGTAATQLTSSASSTITEPVITFGKTIISLPSPLDAGGEVHYRITFANGTGANVGTAWDVHITDALAAVLRLNSTGILDLSVSTTGTVGTVTNNSTVTNIDIWIASVAPGATVTVDFYPVIQSAVTPGLLIDNIGDVTWTSMVNHPAGERDGTGGVNDYTATSSDDFTVPSPYTIAKQITTTTHGGSLTQVAVGDVITYDILLTFPEATIPADTVVDNMPSGLVVIGTPQIITTAAADSYGVLTNNFNATIGTSNITVAADGSSVQFDFTNVVVAGDDNTTNNTILMRYTALVTDDAVNLNGRDIPNDATNTAGSVVDTSNTTHIGVVEPIIVTNKTITSPSPASGVEAGDVITYTTRFTNTGTSTAYEVTAQDTLPANVDYNSGSASCVYFDGSLSVPVAVSVSGTTTLNFGTWDIPATAPDSFVQCTYSITTQSDIALGASHTNVVDADWTSLNGTDANERNYNDSVTRIGVDETPGADDDDAVFTTDVPASLTKGINVTQTAIGDVFHITITIVSPLGSITSTSVVDTVPVGMVYVTGTQSVTSNITTPTFSLTGPNDGTAATTLTWDFGTAIVTGNPVVIQYDARAANLAGNVDGTNLVNNVDFNYTDGGGAHTFTAHDDVTIIEPLLTVNKSHSVMAIAPDAGDTVHYIVDIAPDLTAPNVSTATAYDVVFSDLLPSTYVSLDVSSISVSATGWTPTSVNTSGSTVSAVDVRVSNIPNTPGTNLRIEYDVTLKSAVTPAQLIANTGDITWTSTSGANTNERTGSGTGSNDYSATDNDTFTTHDPAFSKSLVLTDLSTSVSPALVIGEVATFGLHVTLPEGTTPSMRLVDNLPPGFQYVDGSVVVVRTGFNGTVPDPTVTPIIPIGSGTDFQLDFGAITVNADNDAANNTFSVQFQAVVLNENGNQQPNSLVNNATMTVYDGGGTPVWNDSDDVTTNITEPVLTIDKTVSDVYPGANQVLTFTLTVSHTGASTANAYDVLIYDDLPATLTLDLTPASFTTSLTGGATGITNTSSGNRVEFTVDNIPVGGMVQIQFKATVASTVTLNQVINNTAYTDWTSKPGNLTVNPQERTSPGTAWDDYRTSDLLTLTIQKSLSKSLSGHSLFATGLNGGVMDVAIGEILTYDVNFNVPVGATTGVILTDTLDTGLAFVDCVTITASAGITASGGTFANICNTPAVSPAYDLANPSAGGRIVAFNFGNLNNTSGAVGLITVQYRVVVLDVSENSFGVDLNNSVRLDWSVGPLNTHSLTPLNIVEPELTITKIANVNTALPGAEITFTITVSHTAASTADAYDVVMEDILPSGLTYVPGSLVYVSGVVPNRAVPPALDDTNDPTLRVYWDVFGRSPSDESVIQFRATLGNLAPGSSIGNTARVEWTSLPGIPTAALGQPVGVQSQYNQRSIERWYDPHSPVDIYGVSSNFSIKIPPLPNTGFAPGIQTALTTQPADNAYASLGTLWMEIPALGVQIPIVGVPAKTNGWDLTWLGSDAGYLEGTAYPTWAGNTGITGHVTLANGEPGPFAKLSTLYWGQQVIVHMDGQKYIYEVRSVRRVWPQDISVLGHAEYPTLTLITCQGYNQLDNSYNYRIAVQAVLVRVESDDQASIIEDSADYK